MDITITEQQAIILCNPYCDSEYLESIYKKVCAELDLEEEIVSETNEYDSDGVCTTTYVYRHKTSNKLFRVIYEHHECRNSRYSLQLQEVIKTKNKTWTFDLK